MRARLDGDSIVLPLVLVDDTLQRMELQRTGPEGATLAGTTFRVVQSATTAESPLIATAVLKHDILRVPVIRQGDLDYRIELRRDGKEQQFKVSSVTALNAPDQGYAVLSDGRGGYNFESAMVGKDPAFDMNRSLKAFQETLYPYLSDNACSNCHTTKNTTGSGAQAPLHTDISAELAHQYALTRVNFADPANSKLVVRMRIDRHHCPNSNCAAAASDIEDAIRDWKKRIADMLR